MLFENEEEKEIENKSKNNGINQNRIMSMSPKNFDRSKLMNMMKHYTFKCPNMRKISSPKRIFSNGRNEVNK